MSKYTRAEFAEKLGANGDPKLNAAADFAARLLNSPVGDRVARIVLFGSVAYGGATATSDVDIMVFGAMPRLQLSEAAADAAWEATVETGELVSPLTYPLSRLFYPCPYVIYDTLKRGQEIYAMNAELARRKEAMGIYEKGNLLLDEAQVAEQQAAFVLAMVGAYTAAELAAKALVLLKPEVEVPSTHGGVIQIFSREYVKTGEVPRLWVQLLGQKLQTRANALYDTSTFVTAGEVKEAITLARDMLDFLKRKLDETDTKADEDKPE
jgi:uncharacterized protein (UPF0332 family)